MPNMVMIPSFETFQEAWEKYVQMYQSECGIPTLMILKPVFQAGFNVGAAIQAGRDLELAVANAEKSSTVATDGGVVNHGAPISTSNPDG